MGCRTIVSLLFQTPGSDTDEGRAGGCGAVGGQVPDQVPGGGPLHPSVQVTATAVHGDPLSRRAFVGVGPVTWTPASPKAKKQPRARAPSALQNLPRLIWVWQCFWFFSPRFIRLSREHKQVRSLKLSWDVSWVYMLFFNRGGQDSNIRDRVARRRDI